MTSNRSVDAQRGASTIWNCRTLYPIAKAVGEIGCGGRQDPNRVKSRSRLGWQGAAKEQNRRQPKGCGVHPL
jgi:hypothetical protein